MWNCKYLHWQREEGTTVGCRQRKYQCDIHVNMSTLHACLYLFMPFDLYAPINALCNSLCLCTCLHQIFPFTPACGLHTCLCLFFFHLLVPSHPLMALSCQLFIVYFHINILINLYIMLNILVNSKWCCLWLYPCNNLGEPSTVLGTVCITVDLNLAISDKQWDLSALHQHL